MPTIKQRRALDLVAGNGGNMAKAMIAAGYSAVTADTPTKLTRSKGWQELMDKHFPDSKLAALHKKLLDKKEVIVISDGAQEGSHLEWTGQPHTDALRALDTAYKIRGRYVDEPQGGKTLIINITGETASRYGILPSKDN